MRTFINMCIAALLLWGCGAPDTENDECPHFSLRVSSVTHYEYRREFSTPTGIGVDTTGQEDLVSIPAIECIIDGLEACLDEKMADGMELGVYQSPIRRECLNIKIPDNWFVDADGNEWIPCSQGDWCSAAAGTVQGGRLIVVPPNLVSLSHEAAHVVTLSPDPFPQEWDPCTNGIRANNCADFLSEEPTSSAGSP